MNYNISAIKSKEIMTGTQKNTRKMHKKIISYQITIVYIVQNKNNFYSAGFIGV